MTVDTTMILDSMLENGDIGYADDTLENIAEFLEGLYRDEPLLDIDPDNVDWLAVARLARGGE